MLQGCRIQRAVLGRPEASGTAARTRSTGSGNDALQRERVIQNFGGGSVTPTLAWREMELHVRRRGRDGMGEMVADSRTKSRSTRAQRRGATVHGVKTGILFALLYSLAAAALRYASADRPGTGSVIDLRSVIAAYFAMGILGGGIVGFFRASAETSRGRALLSGSLGVIISTSTMATLVGSPWNWDRVGWISAGIFAVIISGFLYVRWDYFFES